MSGDWRDQARAEDLRREGWSISEVAGMLYYSKAQIASWTRGLPYGTSVAIVNRTQRIIDLYLQGLTGAEIGDRVGVGQAYVSWVMVGARARWPEIPQHLPDGSWDRPLPERSPVVRPRDVISWRRSRR